MSQPLQNQTSAVRIKFFWSLQIVCLKWQVLGATSLLQLLLFWFELCISGQTCPPNPNLPSISNAEMPQFRDWGCMWLAYPEGFNSIEYSVILHWTIMSHSDFSENLSPIGFLGDLDWWFCICTAYRHLLIFRIDNVIIVRIRIWISDWYWLWANLNTHLLKKSLCDMDINIAKCKTF